MLFQKNQSNIVFAFRLIGHPNLVTRFKLQISGFFFFFFNNKYQDFCFAFSIDQNLCCGLSIFVFSLCIITGPQIPPHHGIKGSPFSPIFGLCNRVVLPFVFIQLLTSYVIQMKYVFSCTEFSKKKM